MQNIHITRYENPTTLGWAGCIEPEDRSWVAFIGLDGIPRFNLHRDPETGAVLPDDADAQNQTVAALREEQSRRKAFEAPVTGVVFPVFVGEMFQGRTQPPFVALGHPSDGVFAERLTSKAPLSEAPAVG
jgi:hypothetical protein